MTTFSNKALWDRFQRYFFYSPELELGLDISRMNFPEEFFDRMKSRIQKAFDEMAVLEKGDIANPDENRMVGHYWLRNPSMAPTETIAQEIEDVWKGIEQVTKEVQEGGVKGESGPFANLLVIGIGGSALGPQFVSNALGNPPQDRLKVLFFDNTDPDGIDRVLATLDGQLGQTLCLVISKSGGTKETRNGMLEAQQAYRRAGLSFSRHAIAITGFDSELDRTAEREGWLARFPMWDWVGGRTSETSAVGLLPAALQGIDIQEIIRGARECDQVTRSKEIERNPAALLALMWYYAGNGHGAKDMVILPYKDRLEWFSRYLQQLVMESLGKEKDRDGEMVHQGLAVYGNKGSTDQHAYVQQLRDGLNNFFVTFIEVLQDRSTRSMEVEPGVTSGDYLHGFLLGTRRALFENGRESLTLTFPRVTPFTIGVLIALYERAVGLYASLVNLNAYHQPGVEAGKKAAGEIIELKKTVVDFLGKNRDSAFSAEQIAERLGQAEQAEMVFKICQHLAMNEDRPVKIETGETPVTTRYSYSA